MSKQSKVAAESKEEAPKGGGIMGAHEVESECAAAIASVMPTQEMPKMTNEEEKELINKIRESEAIAGRVVKLLYAAAVGKSPEDIWDNVPAGGGKFTYESRKESTKSHNISLDLFDESYKLDMTEIGYHGYIQQGLVHLLHAAIIYWDFLMSTLPKKERRVLDNTGKGTLFVKGGASGLPHIGIKLESY